MEKMRERERKREEERKVERERERDRNKECVLVSLFIRTLILLHQEPTLVTSFNLSYFYKVPISKYSLIGALREHKHSV